MQIYVLDNSVILKPILEEPDAEKARRLFFLKDTFKISILMPDIFRYEFFNKAIKGLSLKSTTNAYKSFTSRQFSIMPLEDDLIELSNKLVAKYPKISFYDAAYHALAKAYHAMFVTADEKYYEMTKKEGNITLLSNLKI